MASGYIDIDLESDCDTLKYFNVNCRNIDYLLEIIGSHKTIQNYSAVGMKVENVQS